MCRAATTQHWHAVRVKRSERIGQINLPRQAEVIAATFHTCVVLLCTCCTDRDHRYITITIGGYEYATDTRVLVPSRIVNSRPTERFILVTTV